MTCNLLHSPMGSFATENVCTNSMNIESDIKAIKKRTLDEFYNPLAFNRRSKIGMDKVEVRFFNFHIR